MGEPIEKASKHITETVCGNGYKERKRWEGKEALCLTLSFGPKFE